MQLGQRIANMSKSNQLTKDELILMVICPPRMRCFQDIQPWETLDINTMGCGGLDA